MFPHGQANARLSLNGSLSSRIYAADSISTKCSISRGTWFANQSFHSMVIRRRNAEESVANPTLKQVTGDCNGDVTS